MLKKTPKNIVPPQNTRKTGMLLPNTPKVIETIGGAYGTDITSNAMLARQYGIQTSKTGGTTSGKSTRRR